MEKESGYFKMTTLETRKKELLEMKELRAKASQGNWESTDYDVTSTEDGCVCVTRDNEYIINRNANDSKFIATSANNFYTIIDQLIIALDALEKIKNEGHVKSNIGASFKTHESATAYEAISKICGDSK